MNNYIITGFGFIRELYTEYNSESNELELIVEYTNKIRYAKVYKTKRAKQLLEKHDIVGFVYNPYEEEPIRDMYSVKKRKCYINDDENLVDEFYIKREVMINETDVKFLQNKKFEVDGLLTHEEAVQKVYELNQKMLTELTSKINKQKIL